MPLWVPLLLSCGVEVLTDLLRDVMYQGETETSSLTQSSLSPRRCHYDFNLVYLSISKHGQQCAVYLKAVDCNSPHSPTHVIRIRHTDPVDCTPESAHDSELAPVCRNARVHSESIVVRPDT